MACLLHLASALTNTDDTLKVAARHLVSTLTNTNDEAEDLAVHRQTCIYEPGSPLSISYPGLKAVQPCRALNRFRTVPDVCGSGCPLPILYCDGVRSACLGAGKLTLIWWQ